MEAAEIMALPSTQRAMPVYEARQRLHMTFAQTATWLGHGCTRDMVSRYIKNAQKQPAAPPPLSFEMPHHTFTGAPVLQSAPVYDGMWNLTGDALILNDLHIPATNWELADVALRVAANHLEEPRTLILLGDVVNLDALSIFRRIVPCTRWGTIWK